MSCSFSRISVTCTTALSSSSSRHLCMPRRQRVRVESALCPIIYEGPRTVEGLWDEQFYDARSVKVGTARITRYRPLFRSWSVVCDIAYDQESIDRDQVLKCLEDAGQYCGVGDYRPKFGRFAVEVL